ncbi:MAG: VCBS repeat-containing protein [Bacteroidetes bacterium]|nr:VCBS repeat-containing protein [Bacteroidota bacterium]
MGFGWFDFGQILGNYFGFMGISDLNNDCKKDVIFRNKDTIGILYRQDSSSFIRKNIHINKPSATSEFIVADINKDGYFDLISSSTFSIGTDIYILFQYANDSFAPIYLKFNSESKNTIANW